MNKNLLLKIAFLAISLTVLLAGLFVMIHSSSGDGKTQTLFYQFVTSGGVIVWFVLLPMSLITVYLATEYALTIRRKVLLPPDAARKIIEIWQDFGPEQLPQRLDDSKDFVTTAVIKAASQGAGDWFRMKSLIAESIQEQTLTLFRKIEWMNLIGNVAPMVGLFGTVLGIIKMFNALALAGGQPHSAQLAGGISIALVTTFWGLLIAIPALTIHGAFQNRIETLAGNAVTETEKLLAQIADIFISENKVRQPRPRPSIVNIPSEKQEDLYAL
ncbi:MAG: MotA/TolQ/ExbB proton channel family protein [Planctomycetota bacterium]|nr:MotA/TolQ/ExbB proton channel family protein [Planctomycetota bacterium]